jgi:flavodoxin
MKAVIISYSFTGNNQALAAALAKELDAAHVVITEPKPRSMFKIMLDVLFNRVPTVNPPGKNTRDYDLVIFMAPVWMGLVASPLRSYLKQFKNSAGRYVFVSISGGTNGPNAKLAGELAGRTGKEPALLLDLHIADLLPAEPKPTKELTAAYRLNEADVKKLTGTIMEALRQKGLISP